MDIIKEYEEDEVETGHGDTPPHVRKLRQFSQQLQQQIPNDSIKQLQNYDKY